MSLILGIMCYVIGFAFGFVAAAYVSCVMDKNAVRCGMIKLCGSIYKLDKIDV